MRQTLLMMAMLIGLASMAGTAQAAEGGWDRDHYWLKVSAREVVTYGAMGACGMAIKAPQAVGWACPPIAGALSLAVGKRGAWAEMYPGGYGWIRVPGYRLPQWRWIPPRFNYGYY